MTAYRLYTHIGKEKELVLEGAQQLIDVCHKINHNATEEVLKGYPLSKLKKRTKETMDEMCYDLYVKVIKFSISGAMPAPTNAEGKLDIKNGYYHIAPEQSQRLQEALKRLKAESGFESKKRAFGGTQIPSLVEIERSKLVDMARVIKAKLEENPNNKVVLCLNYTGPDTGILSTITELLKDYNPLILVGSVPTKKRQDILNMFNNDPSRRLLIANTQVISVGVTMHSTSVDSNRFMFISPSYHLLTIIQASHRLFGEGLKTDAIVRIFYAITEGVSEAEILEFMFTSGKKKSANLDAAINESLNKKSVVLGQAIDDITKSELILPSDYENEFEP
jgi:hypothetical protein